MTQEGVRELRNLGVFLADERARGARENEDAEENRGETARKRISEQFEWIFVSIRNFSLAAW